MSFSFPATPSRIKCLEETWNLLGARPTVSLGHGGQNTPHHLRWRKTKHYRKEKPDTSQILGEKVS